MNNGFIIKTYQAKDSLKGSEILATGADTLIVKEKGAYISINPQNGSEFIKYTFNDEVKITSADRVVFKKPTMIALVCMGCMDSFHDVSFCVSSTETLVCPVAPTVSRLAGVTQVREIRGFEIQTDAVKNISGRTVTMVGDIGIQLEQTENQPATLLMASQTSDDGITWTFNPSSLREIYVSKDGIDYISIPSFHIGDWEHNQSVRFVFAKIGPGGVSLLSPTATLDGETTTGQTFIWTMRERIRN